MLSSRCERRHGDAVALLRDQRSSVDAAFRRVISDLDLDEIRNVEEPNYMIGSGGHSNSSRQCH